MLRLSPADIHLWQYEFGDAPRRDHLRLALPMLSETERLRAATFRFEKHRVRFAMSHAMVRLALSQYADVEPAAWQFARGAWGKPYISGPTVDAALTFNLSHTDHLAVCAIGLHPQLGVDVENTVPPFDGLASQYFAAAEQTYLESLPASRQREAFYRIWTLKEAYIKGVGKGLAIPLDSFAFGLEGPGPAKLSTARGGDEASWQFIELNLELDHRLAIAAQAAGPLHLQRHDASQLFAGTFGSGHSSWNVVPPVT